MNLCIVSPIHLDIKTIKTHSTTVDADVANAVFTYKRTYSSILTKSLPYAIHHTRNTCRL